MRNFFSHKKIVTLLALVPVILGLVSLGVRLPALMGIGNAGPKPRPRALLQNQIKTCNERIEKHNHNPQQPAFTAPVCLIPPVGREPVKRHPHTAAICRQVAFHPTVPSRASPLSS